MKKLLAGLSVASLISAGEIVPGAHASGSSWGANKTGAVNPHQQDLEKLQEHNGYIRGTGYLKRVLDFLLLLKEMKIYSMVMLTLTRENMAQVLALAEILQDKPDLFTFNRLAMMGKGAALGSVGPSQ
ncbi:selenobiotic family radical SAM modification target peptide [Desulforhopalus sp. IMCC35007]|uniref:selenobiotic family radical SAM modification target peptide n=1 Tax=Desulforhopalus sp. IMCC35007 TaxID=2569543 RepID=UPI0010AE258B|nr:hypothetical protein FCL48_14805 [Desulforhopalus sp. IMCC35007]